ncbi:MAG: type VII secretion target [Anaerolineales bacterium]
MTRIRVNTEDLKAKAKDFESAADAINKAGDDILAAALSMPSYDGQLSGPARKAGYEIQTGCREIKAGLSSNAESLRKTAQAFEEVDNQVVAHLQQNQELLRDSSYTSILLSDDGIVGTRYCGYEETDEYIILWCNGESTKIYKNSDDYEQHLNEINGFRSGVDEFWNMVNKSGYPWAIWQKLEDSCKNCSDMSTCLDALFGFGGAASISDMGDVTFNLMMMMLSEDWDWTLIYWTMSIFTGGEEGAIIIIKNAFKLKLATCGIWNNLKPLESEWVG